MPFNPPDSGTSRLWTLPFAATIVVYTLTSLSNYMLVGVLPAWVVHEGGSRPEAGLVVSLFSLAALASRPLFGIALEKIGRPPVLAFGALAFLAGTIGQIFCPGLVPLLAWRVAQGVGFSAVSTASAVVLADVSPRSRLSEGLGWLQMATALNFAAGPMIGLALTSEGDFGGFYLVIASLTIAAAGAALVIRYRRTPVAASTMTPADPAGQLPSTTWPLAAMVLLLMVSMGCVVTFIPLFGRTLGIDHMAWFFPVYAGASVVGVRLGAVGLAARWGRRRVLGSSLVLATVAMAGLSAFPWLPAALVCAVLYGIGYSTAQTLLTASLLEGASEKTRGLANAVNFAAMDVGMTIGPVGAGAFAEVFSIHWLYLLAALSVLAALVVHVALGKRPS